MADQNDTTEALTPCPPELVGIAAQLDQLRPPARAAAVAAMYAVVSAMVQSPVNADRPPLTNEMQAVIDYIREHGVSSAADLSKHTGYSERTIHRWCAKDGPLTQHGVMSTTRGYGLSLN